ncbi:uncharacterized protein [Diadema setosum]|uniref:uncharacterized protein n=1 Tax=Diadema setosum TaxID=31175 RepID=UPI003B3A3F9D
MTTQCVQVKLELGHRATIRAKPTQEGFTHDWTMFVRGPEGSSIEHFVDKVVFQLHESFQRPKRVVKEPPFEISQSGYAGFEMAIDVYFRNKEEPKKVRFQYDLFLHMPKQPPVNHIRCEKLTFRNPTEDFRRKLLKAGGVGVIDLEIPTTTLKLNASTGGKPSTPSSVTPSTDPSAFTKGKPRSGLISSGLQGSKKPKSIGSTSTSSTTSKDVSKSSNIKPKEFKDSGKQKAGSKDIKTTSKDSKGTAKESKPVSKDPKQQAPREPKPSPREPKASPREPKPSPKDSKVSQKVSSKDIKSSSENKPVSSKEGKDSKPSSKGTSKESGKQAPKRQLSEQSPAGSATPAKKRKQSTSTKEEKQKDDAPLEGRSSVSGKQSTKSKTDKTLSGEKGHSVTGDKGGKSKDKTTKVKKSSAANAAKVAADQMLFAPEITKTKPKPKAKKEPKKELPQFEAELSTEEAENEAHSPSSSISSLTIRGGGGGTGTLNMLMKDLLDDDDDPDMGRTFHPSSLSPGHYSISSNSNLSGNSRNSSPSPEIEKPKPTPPAKSVSSKKSSATSKKGAKAEKKPKNADGKQKSHNSNIDYLYELVELHKRLMKLTDRDKLQQVVDLIGETGSFKVTDKTFDFDLCSLDKTTIKKLQEYVPSL